MSTVVVVPVENLAEVMETYESIELERATSAEGTYSTVTVITLVEDTYYYEYTDAAGNVNSWYRYRYHHDTGPVNSDYSNPFPMDGLSRLKIRQGVLKDWRAGVVFETSAAVSTTVIRTTDYRVKSGAFRAGRGRNSTLYAASGAQAGDARLVTNSDPSAGEFTTDAWDSTVAQGVQMEWHTLIDPNALHDALNRAVDRYYYSDKIPIQGVEGQLEYDLTSFAPWIRSRKQVMSLWTYASTDAAEQPWTGFGRWANTRQDGDHVTLLIAPATTQVLYLEALRPMPKLYTDESVLPLVSQPDTIIALTYDECLAWLLQPGQMASSEDRTAWQNARALLRPKLLDLLRRDRPQPRYNMSISNEPPNVPQPYKAR